MVVGQLLSADYTVEIRLHQLLDQIDLIELGQGRWPEDIEDCDDILVVKVAKELDLAEGA